MSISRKKLRKALRVVASLPLIPLYQPPAEGSSGSCSNFCSNVCRTLYPFQFNQCFNDCINCQQGPAETEED
ncbi:hypothetical protein M3689_12120 [Alkalihalophilus marmarensis]|uniref:Uncharacterized protein n=1 Tax=Alkalihalophilus marmarensis DSM 21297 TaxID=1188261 RepID=U6SPT1_9BACI|nr:hypothetical protein [Alkalihalophilus marmarensis]ERN53739.1 hypothetical protein A33I_11060 [Alkalihalophilus marmarensis DSM 21297]MCM3490057.1 hypothetical protein [Alkalihalophilus marmarensis]